MKKNVEQVVTTKNEMLPGSCKRVASLIGDKTLRRAYIKAMIDAENTYQRMKRVKSKEKSEDS